MSRDGRRTQKAAAAPIVIMLVASLLTGAAMLTSNNQAGVDGNAPSGSASSSATSAQPVAQSSSSSAQSNAEGVLIGAESVSSTSNNADRAKNLATAAAALDGTVIQPGKTMSLNDVLNKAGSTYLAAPEAADGNASAVRAGGVSQLASALYVAAVRSNLNVVERHAHQSPSDYAAVGLDAEIDLNKNDLKIRNDGKTPVYVHAAAEGQTVTVSLFGTPREDGKTFDIVATVTDEGGSEGAQDSGTVTVEVRKVEYSNGTKQSDQLLSKDTYKVEEGPFLAESGMVSVTK